MDMPIICKRQRRADGAESTVVVMSGNFVQRGEPAIVQKHVRAEAALSCGADLVLELPFVFSLPVPSFLHMPVSGFWIVWASSLIYVLVLK